MPSISYSVIKPASIRPLVAAGGGQAFRQQAGERRRRASSLQLASPPVATRNGLACLLPECAILTHKFCHRAKNPYGGYCEGSKPICSIFASLNRTRSIPSSSDRGGRG